MTYKILDDIKYRTKMKCIHFTHSLSALVGIREGIGKNNIQSNISLYKAHTFSIDKDFR